MKAVNITPADVPTSVNFDVRSSSFFQYHSQLPSPEEVRSRARAQYLADTHWGWKTRGVATGYNAHPTPAVFEFENILLFVKWGSDVRISEAQTLYTIRKSYGDSIPVPEIYGWRKDGDEMFLYMEAIRGKTLEEVWPALNENERLHICGELRTILSNLRQLKQDPSDRFIGKLAYFEVSLLFYGH
jgi:aminoglycoside phosphotransferase